MGIKTRKIDEWQNPVVGEDDRPNRPAAQMKAIFDSNSNQLKDSLNGMIDDLRAGDVDVSFTQAEQRTELETGDTLTVLFGKIKKWLTDTLPAIQTVKKDQGVTRFLRGDGVYAVPEAGMAANGMPAGGTTGQALLKKSGQDFDGKWETLTPKSIGAAAASHAASHAAGGADALTPAAIGAVPAVEKGAANGVATLDTAGKVAAAQASAAIVEKTAAYTLELTDAGKLIALTADTALTVTVPANSAAAFPIGTEIELAQLGAGAVTVAAAEGVTVHSLDNSVKLAGQYAAACLKKIAADTWLLGGALE